MSDKDTVSNKPYHIMAKPTGAICNLDCTYCFYLDKSSLYPDTKDFKMTDEVLETFVRDYVKQPSTEITFTWQGGEPTLMGLEFYNKVLELQNKYKPKGKTIRNSIQTNGVSLNKEWASFFKENDFLVGVSLDGPERLHNRYRLTKGQGPTFGKVMRGIGHLKEQDVEYNILCCLNSTNVEEPLQIYKFLKNHSGTNYWQFIPVVEQNHHRKGLTEYSVTAEQYGQFITSIFNWWVRRDLGKISIQLFDMALRRYLGMSAGLCVFERECGNALALEHNGDIYSCDHYVDGDHHLGNVNNTSLTELVDLPIQRQFGKNKTTTLPDCCRKCEVLELCNGGCPKNRFVETETGEEGLNYLCSAYKKFFEESAPYLNFIADQYRNQTPINSVMNYIKETPSQFMMRLPNRNDQCYCGSGRKFKRCCM